MKIISLESENIKRLKAVRIKPDGLLVQITGKNGAGKTSVLDSIMMALAGGSTIPEKPIRDGSLLDADNMRIIGEMAEANDSQVWVERVAADEKVGIVIEDGEVVGK